MNWSHCSSDKDSCLMKVISRNEKKNYEKLLHWDRLSYQLVQSSNIWMIRNNEWKIATESCSTDCKCMKSLCKLNFTDVWRVSILHCITCMIMYISFNTQNSFIRNAYFIWIIFLDLHLTHASYFYQSFNAIQISMLLKV